MSDLAGGRLRAALALALSMLCCPAHAEVGSTLSVVSDDRYRGRSYSGGRATTSLALAYDDARGPYAGITATASFSKPELISVQEYVGYAYRTKAGLRLDVGMTNYDYTRFYSLGQARNYYEGYAGIGNRHVSAHVYYSPDYIGLGYESAYFDLAATARWREHWRVTGHLGYLDPLTRPSRFLSQHGSYDWRVGVSRRIGRAEFQLAWNGNGPPANVYRGRPQRRASVVAGATWAF